jgi:hypothetical protein
MQNSSLGGDGDSVYTEGVVYSGWGSSVNPAGPSVIQTWSSAGLIVPLPDLGKVLILGGVLLFRLNLGQ